jgi:Tfp pilus assembly PilM family ATPase
MSRLVAIEWDAKEVRALVGRKKGTALAIDRAIAAPLPEREEGSTAEPEVGKVLSKALADLGVSRSEALVAVGRANIELRFLSTPPVPEEELPDIVRFQAMRQFTTLGDDWPLDYVPLAPNADGGMNVLAAAIAPDLLNQIRKDCHEAGVTVARLVLRPFAAASLLKDQHADGKCRMIVDLLKDEADLTVLIGAQVIFPRTVRLPLSSDIEVLGRTLLAEGRRTMIAAQNQLGGRKVDEIVFFGDGTHHAALKQLLEKELQLTVKLVDPFEGIEWSDTRAARPEYPGTFAPLVGMLREEVADAKPVVDFLHPRKRPPPPNQRRKLAIMGAAVAAVVLLGLGIMQWRLWSLDSELNQLRIARFKAEKLAKDSAKPLKDAETLDAFAASDVTWLDELSLVSARLPPPEQVEVAELTAQVVPKMGGGQIKFSGFADTSKRVSELEIALRDAKHVVSGKGMNPDPQREKLQWSFAETVTVASPLDAPPPANATAKSATARTAAAKSPAAGPASSKTPGGAK